MEVKILLPHVMCFGTLKFNYIIHIYVLSQHSLSSHIHYHKHYMPLRSSSSSKGWGGSWEVLSSGPNWVSQKYKLNILTIFTNKKISKNIIQLTNGPNLKGNPKSHGIAYSWYFSNSDPRGDCWAALPFQGNRMRPPSLDSFARSEASPFSERWK